MPPQTRKLTLIKTRAKNGSRPAARIHDRRNNSAAEPHSAPQTPAQNRPPNFSRERQSPAARCGRRASDSGFKFVAFTKISLPRRQRVGSDALFAILVSCDLRFSTTTTHQRAKNPAMSQVWVRSPATVIWRDACGGEGGMKAGGVTDRIRKPNARRSKVEQQDGFQSRPECVR